MESYNPTTVIFALLAGVVVLFALCVILVVKLYQAMRDNSILQYQIAAITADDSQEKTFKVIDDDLQKIFKELQLINKNTSQILQP